VSQSKAKRAAQDGGLAGRARDVIVMAVPAGQRAGTAAAAAGTAAATQMQRGVHHARRWSAPRIEGFADMVETTITPHLTSSLRHGAEAVKPEQESRLHSVTRSMMNWRGAVALLAVLGAAGAAAGYAMRRRYMNATDEAEKDSANAPAPGVVPVQPMGEDKANKNSVGSGW
jgi:hypothetical protein